MTLLMLSPVFSKPDFGGTSTRGTFSSLDADLRRYQLASLAQGTIKTYSSGENQFTNFYYQFHLHKHLPLLPTTENILNYFAVFLAKTVNPGTIKVYFHINLTLQSSNEKFVGSSGI
jgi:hypothetical protein